MEHALDERLTIRGILGSSSLDGSSTVLLVVLHGYLALFYIF